MSRSPWVKPVNVKGGASRGTVGGAKGLRTRCVCVGGMTGEQGPGFLALTELRKRLTCV